MTAPEKQYAKLVNNKWQTCAGQDDNYELDEDGRYLLDEKIDLLNGGGFHLCPHCEVMMEFDPHDLYCAECGWSADSDAQWNEDQCAA